MYIKTILTIMSSMNMTLAASHSPSPTDLEYNVEHEAGGHEGAQDPCHDHQDGLNSVDVARSLVHILRGGKI